MSNINPIIYPVDYSGTNSGNLISNEVVTLTTATVRAFSPLYSPFFSDSMQIKDVTSGLTLSSNQYKLYYLNATASALLPIGKEVYSIVIITDSNVSNNLAVTYQTIGGSYTTGYETITTLVNNLLTTPAISNSNPLDWDALQNLPSAFPATLHLHTLGDTVGWEFIANQLEMIRVAILLGDQLNKDWVMDYIANLTTNATAAINNLMLNNNAFSQHVLNTNNPHNVTASQLGLGNVQNYPVATLAQAYAGVTNTYLTADTALAVVKNTINLGIDAHIVDYNNPHNVTTTQIGLGNVQNYGIASSSDISNPNVNSPLYVTNVGLSNWLTSYYSNQNTLINNEIVTLTTSVNAAIESANAAQLVANNALQAANSAATSSNNAVVNSNLALQAATQNNTDVQNAQSNASTLIQTYASQAIVAAQMSGYEKGYTDGYTAGKNAV